MIKYIKNKMKKHDPLQNEILENQQNYEAVTENESINSKHADLKLSLNNDLEEISSEFQKEFLKDELKNLPPLKSGEVNITGIYTYDLGDKIEVYFYIRNGLEKTINLNKIPLKIIDSNGHIMGKQTFNMKGVGDIPACSARPCKVYFDKENVFVDKIPQDDWRLEFNSQLKASSTVKVELENLPEAYSSRKCEEYYSKLPPIQYGTMSVSVYEINERNNGDLAISIIVRNATDRKMRVEKLPVTVKETESGQILTSGIFNIEELLINPFKAEIRNIVFKKYDLSKDKYDVNKLSIFFSIE